MKRSFFDWLDHQILDFSKSDVRKLIVNIPKHPKRAILMVTDFCLLSFALWLSLSLRLNKFYIPENTNLFVLFLAAPTIGLLVLFFLGVYKTVTRFIIFSDILRIHFGIILSILIWTIPAYLFNDFGLLPRSTPLSYGLFSIFLVWFSRWIASSLLKGQEHYIGDKNKNSKKVIVYGAGITGIQLAGKLSKLNEYQVMGFIDDNPSLWKRRARGHKIHSPDYIPTLLKENNIKDVILALPTASISERKRIIRFLEPYHVAVHTLPAVEDIVSGRVSVGDLKLVGVEDLLGRDPVPPNSKLLDQAILDKSVFVTGAGGSIGSELSRQILKSRPKTLILLDISEVALYLIEQNLLEYQKILSQQDEGSNHAPNTISYLDIDIIPVLGSILDKKQVERVMAHYKIQTIFHAAAYKHVPLVEANPMIAIKNNLYGTKIVSDTALKYGIERFVLISTDKAVRPTNIMGATKRLAEMYLQALSDQSNNKKTIFTMVRFGNVLDSSGSVVKKFKKQIRQGGPVTVTDPNIIRYFMSIPEAAELVIQAGAMAQGGEVYVLDMGEAIKIRDLAWTMIRLMGLEVRNEGNPNGDIEVLFTGLRAGEKLYEEYFISETSTHTKHPRILKNNEDFMTMPLLTKELTNLEKAMEMNDLETIYHLFETLVSGYVPSTEIQTQSNHEEQPTIIQKNSSRTG